MSFTAFRRTLAAATAAVLCSALSGGLHAHAASPVPFGTVLIPGSQWAGQYAPLGDLNVYSNGDGTTGTVGAYGQEYQCTELAIRWAALRYGEPVSWTATSAADMWNAGPRMPIPFRQEPNGGAIPPAFGDILVFGATSFNATGHVAVVSAVTETSVTAVHQNVTLNGVPTGIATTSITGTYMPPVWGLPIIGWLHVYSAVNLAPLGTSKATAAIAMTDNRISAMPSTGGSFGTPMVLSTSRFFGSRSTVFADLSGPGQPASAVAINDSSIWVEANTGVAGLSAPTSWSAVPFYGSRSTLMADVGGSGRASAVAINDVSIWVMVNNAGSFGPPQRWSAVPFYGSRGTFMADIDGSGRASAVALNDSSVWVMLNTGTGFSAPTLWSMTPFYGSRGTFVADIDGSGKASLVAINDSSIWVEANPSGQGLAAPALWSSGPFYATSAYMADVDGSGRASAVVATSSTIWVKTNLGGSFGPPTLWYSGPLTS